MLSPAAVDVLAVVLAAAFVVLAAAQQRRRAARERAEAAAAVRILQDEQQQRDEAAAAPGGALVESFTLGWLNAAVRALWVPVLEKHVAAAALEAVQKALNEAMEQRGGAGGRGGGPLPRLFSAVTVESLTFGGAPPQLGAAVARYEPARQLLTISLDCSYASSGAQAVVLLRTRAAPPLPALEARVEATRVRISGRLRLGVQFTAEAPGVKGCYYVSAGGGG